MKTMKKILGVVLVLSLLVVLNVSAMAYDVTVYGGDSGTIGGAASRTYSDSVNIGTGIVSVTNDKYFAKGFALAGHGSYTYDGTRQYTATLELEAEEDVDYVVVYGVKATQISYTVSYVDANGNPLTTDAGSTSDIYYANDGDYVYIAAPYIDGYAVTTANGVSLDGAYYAGITVHEGTEIVFGYAVPTATVVTNTVTTTTTTTTNVVNGDGTPANADTANADNANAAPGEAGTTTDNAGQPAETVIEEQQTPTAAPNEDNTVDLDGTDDTPTSNFFGGDTDEEDANHIPVGARFAIAGVGVVAVGVGVFFLVKTLRKKVS